MSNRLEPKDRKAQLLAVALNQAASHGYQNLKRLSIASEAGVAESLVSKYLGTMPDLKRDVMRAAIRLRRLEIIAQGLALKDRHALKAPEELRIAALNSIKH